MPTNRELYCQYKAVPSFLASQPFSDEFEADFKRFDAALQAAELRGAEAVEKAVKKIYAKDKTGSKLRYAAIAAVDNIRNR
jgi:hypothetical protein